MGALDDGPLIIPINQLRQMLADSYWWRRIVDPDTPWDDETALAHTHIDAVDSPQDANAYTFSELAALRPYAIVYQAGGDGFELTSNTLQRRCHVPKGHLVLHIQINTPESLNNDESALGDYLNKLFGKLVQTADPDKPGILDLSGTAADRMPINRVIVGAYERSPEEDRDIKGDVIMCDIDVYWGRDR